MSKKKYAYKGLSYIKSVKRSFMDKKVILIVDDDLILLNIMGALLLKDGYEVIGNVTTGEKPLK